MPQVLNADDPDFEQEIMREARWMQEELSIGVRIAQLEQSLADAPEPPGLIRGRDVREVEIDALKSRLVELKIGRERWASDRALGKLRDEFKAAMETKGPPAPPPWDPVFDWWYRYGKPKGMKLKALAVELNCAKGTIYNNHTNYKAQYGEAPIPDLDGSK